MTNTAILSLSTHGNPTTGYLSFFELHKEIPFHIKRIYYTYNVPVNTKRGMHAHKKLKQILWCPYGIIEVFLNDGTKTETYLLDVPEKALLIGNGIWHDMHWKKEGSVLCVAASDYYYEEDYIRDYNEFLRNVQDGYWKNENKL
ncbi:sugar 3,4-ketoisomerase [Candidatus Formimonas warabiya]|uniref:Sugar 3,4-ketoisomerase QdtA cupin domain-containing protein n=1 Tax=Formimonas warabiya TaxID=1761012 RepID=A0A3G1KPU2_FORW1|nr:FdtA/QdtA family cupin domain-containing protein [Candidatus Formimonas warabiya]ATW24493.1 hypothetical protein DCMF_06605 [Candidatus Formimonas warabiya]